MFALSKPLTFGVSLKFMCSILSASKVCIEKQLFYTYIHYKLLNF